MNIAMRIVVVAPYLLPALASADASVEVETGAVWQTRNDVAIPGDSGTRLAFDQIIGSGPWPFYRIYADYQASERHAWRALYAPLELAGTGTLDAPASFAGKNFAPGAVHASYRFNSYRLSYRYLWHDATPWQWHVGLTAKIRDARVALEQGSTLAENDNLGFVPLLHVDGAARLSERWQASIDVDAAAAPQGRAIDLALKARYQHSPEWDLAMAYRTLEGGADNEKVYTFAWLHYLVVSARARF